MKKIAIIGAAIISLAGLTAASAATPGGYAGLGAGYSQTLQNFGKDLNVNNSVVKTSTSKGYATGRAFVGYNFNQYFGVEGGYTYLGQSSFNVESKNVTPASSAKVTNRLQDGDLVAKAYLPVGDQGFNLYALGGAAYVHSTVSASATQGSKTVNISDSDTTTNAVRPKFGVGVSYDIPNSALTTSLEVSRVQGQGGKSAIPSVNSAMLTVSYNFGGF